ncbi:Beta-lactamase/transpeptidase-like protein [Rhypophila sp. PSN 637]
MVSVQALLLAALALTADAITSPDRSRALSSQLKAKLDVGFSTAVREKRVPGITSLTLNRDGSVIYNNSFGTVKIDDPSSAPVTANTKMAIASMTKAVVSVAALQLIEQKKLNLNDAIEKYIPSWANLSVITGFSPSGQPILRPPKFKAKVIHLLTHTAGPAYFFDNENIKKWQAWAATQPSPPPQPLAADPGTGWFYGPGTATLGHIIEAISGLRLDVYFNKHIFGPLSISPNTTGIVKPNMWSHFRSPDGTIVPDTSAPVQPPDDPFGDAYLISTITDYADFLLPLINDGRHPKTGVQILSPETAKKYLFADLYPKSLTAPGFAPGKKEAGPGLGNWISSDPILTNNYTFFPGIKKGWSSSWLLNKQDLPGRRKAMSGSWAGIMNTYYWVDDRSGNLGIVMTSLLPFLDKEVLKLFDLLEEVVYDC